MPYHNALLDSATRRCRHCSIVKPLISFRPDARYRGGHRWHCQECEAERVSLFAKTPRGVESARRRNRKSYDRNATYLRAYHCEQNRLKPWKKLLQTAKRRATKADLAFDLTFEWGKARWTGHCELTGLPFRRFTGKLGPNAFSPSIDRIDNARGYTQDNCRIILAGVNSLKNSGTDEEMLTIALRLVAGLTALGIAPMITVPGMDSLEPAA